MKGCRTEIRLNILRDIYLGVMIEAVNRNHLVQSGLSQGTFEVYGDVSSKGSTRVKTGMLAEA